MSMITKIQGKLKQIEGGLTGDRLRVAQGTVEKALGDFGSAASRIAGKAKRAVRRAVRRTEEPSTN